MQYHHQRLALITGVIVFKQAVIQATLEFLEETLLGNADELAVHKICHNMRFSQRLCDSTDSGGMSD